MARGLFGRRKSTEQTRLFYASDFHGSGVCFRKFINAAQFYRAHTLVLGGDLAGKAIVPIVEDRSNWRAEFIGEEYLLASAGELAEFERAVRFNGFYPYRTTVDEVDMLQGDTVKMQKLFERLIKETLEEWLAYAAEKLKGTDTVVCAIAGNDDETFLDDLIKESEVVSYNDEVVISSDGYQILGFSHSNPTPWDSPRELSEDDLYVRLRSLLDGLDVGPQTIFNFHVPPYNCGLDTAPEVRPDLSMVVKGGQPNMIPVGSKAIREVIEELQPALSLHGHIHESRGVVSIGSTTAVNAGSAYNEGRLYGALISLGSKGIEDCRLLMG